MLPREENGDGIMTDKTFWRADGFAQDASAATTAESMPPDKPSTARSKPILAGVVADAEHKRIVYGLDVVAGQAIGRRNCRSRDRPSHKILQKAALAK